MRWLNVCLVLALLNSQVAFSDVIRVKKGETITIPFDGRVIPDDMFERMVKAGLELEGCKKKLSLIREEEQEVCRVKLDVERKTCEVKIQFHKKYEDYLEKTLRKQNSFWRSPFLYFLMGALTAVAVTWGLAYAVK